MCREGQQSAFSKQQGEGAMTTEGQQLAGEKAITSEGQHRESERVVQSGVCRVRGEYRNGARQRWFTDESGNAQRA